MGLASVSASQWPEVTKEADVHEKKALLAMQIVRTKHVFFSSKLFKVRHGNTDKLGTALRGGEGIRPHGPPLQSSEGQSEPF